MHRAVVSSGERQVPSARRAVARTGPEKTDRVGAVIQLEGVDLLSDEGLFDRRYWPEIGSLMVPNEHNAYKDARGKPSLQERLLVFFYCIYAKFLLGWWVIGFVRSCVRS